MASLVHWITADCVGSEYTVKKWLCSWNTITVGVYHTYVTARFAALGVLGAQL